MTTTSAAARFAAAFAALYVAHGLGDHWIQTSGQATRKGDPGPAGRRACAGHVATYTATAAVALAAVNRVTRAGITPRRALAGLALSAATHYVIDRRDPLKSLARILGRSGYVEHCTVVRKPGAPADGCGPGTGLYHLDQTAHTAILAAAALIAAGRN